MIIINVLPEDIVSEKHVSFYTVKETKEIVLYEVIEQTFKHPDAPEDAYITCLTTRMVISFDRAVASAAALLALRMGEDLVEQYRIENENNNF